MVSRQARPFSTHLAESQHIVHELNVPLARRKVSELHGPESHPLQASLREYPTAYMSLRTSRLRPSVITSVRFPHSLTGAADLQSNGAGQAIVEHDARAKTGDVLLRRHPLDVYLVFALHLVTRVLKPVCDVSIVGQEEQPLRFEVEPTDVPEASVFIGKHVVDGSPSVGILCGAQNTGRLVKANPAHIRKANRRPVQLDVVSDGVDRRSEPRDDGSIYADSAIENHHFGLPPGGHASPGQEFLNPHTA